MITLHSVKDMEMENIQGGQQLKPWQPGLRIKKFVKRVRLQEEECTLKCTESLSVHADVEWEEQ